GVQDNFFELGGDSILSIRLVGRARQAGLHLTPKQLFLHPSVAELCAVVGSSAEVVAEQGRVAGEVPLTPVQHWFFGRDLAEPHHFNQSSLLEVRGDVPAAIVKRALRAVAEHHDALRLRYTREGSGWRQVHAAPGGELPFEHVDLTGVVPDRRSGAISAVGDRVQRSLDLARGPLARGVFFEFGGGEPGRLLLVVHHLVVDGVSWRILEEDLLGACTQLLGGEPVRLPSKTTSFQLWSRRLHRHAQSAAMQEELAWWSALADRGIAGLPTDHPGGPNTAVSARTVVVELDEEETRALLQEVPPVYRTQVNEVLLTALTLAFARWTGQRSLYLDMEGHGREELLEGVDLSRTVGWFTSIYPVLLELPAGGAGEALRSIKEQLRAVPNRGIGYGVLRYLSESAGTRERLGSLPRAEVVFNYLGRFDSGAGGDPLIRPGVERHGRGHSPLQARSHLLEINGMAAQGRLRFEWTFGEEVHARETVERLAEGFRRALLELVAHCRSPGAGGYTSADFPLARASPGELERVLGGRVVEDLYVLSPLQEGMLFHSAYAEGLDPYVSQFGYVLAGRLDVAAFRRAWAQAVAAHPVLRTAFVWEGLQRPLQVVEPRVEPPWRVEDWSHLGEVARESALERYLEADRAEGFALSLAPLMRFGLFRTGPEEHRFVWSSHHLLLDGWSIPLVLRGVLGAYEALARGAPARPAPARPFRDYVAWLERQDLAAAEGFWRQSLRGFGAATPLAASLGRRAVPGETGPAHGEGWVRLPEALSARLEELARTRQLTLNTLVQGAWGLLLWRYSGEEDVLFGATVSGRPAELEGVEEMVGMFINTLPVRVQVSPPAEAARWLGALQAAQVEARQYDYAPLARVQGWSEVPRGGALFESLLVFQNYPVEAGARGGEGALQVLPAGTWERTSYPLALVVVPARELRVVAKYHADVFDAGTVERMLGHLRVLLEGIAAEPQRRVGELELLGPGERHQVVQEWSGAREGELPAVGLVHELIRVQAQRSPGAVAVVHEGETLTYAELEGRANRLAHHLRGLGVGPEVRVGVCVERSVELVVALLGVLKAGGAYVPLDPAYPAERLRFLLEDARVGLLLTRTGLRERLPGVEVPVLCMDAQAERIAREPEDAPQSGATPESLAYVIYTSGSTGRPKGSLIPHQGLSRYLAWAGPLYGGGRGRGAPVHSSLSFDLT
ncbi:MAG TPA: condensation domain-containing protein, partial [Longimicrobiaceae bacterium]|nr:condensation domain-containing protein [Longimicrobiaceae bacterium]